MGTEGTLVAFSGNDVEVVVEPFFPFSVLFFSSLLFWFCSKGTALAPSSQRWCSGDSESTESWILCLQAKLSSLFFSTQSKSGSWCSLTFHSL
ncbi:hypothetical protein MRB53_013740 [Persea americana]|uniref:Uncharacterized protein n=1 Tax=Persea americana TaxID=3435 RepID=A0ACC2K8W6_PERAE|nr:hypothetical protein MRB53_013740 [Persea americana]